MRTRIQTAAGWYSEAAHIRPLGIPHNGHDVLSNVLCLCPNCHKRFDGHALTIDDEFRVYDMGVTSGRLNVHGKHVIDRENLRYQRFIAGVSASGDGWPFSSERRPETGIRGEGN